MRTIDVIRDSVIERIVQESSNVRSFFFRDGYSVSSLPGQFAMVYLPGAGEFPMSLSLPSKLGLASIGVKAMGEGSKLLYESKVGDHIGFRGPYGRGFEFRGRSINVRSLLVGGGTAMVPMLVLAKALSLEKKKKTSLVIAARTRSEIPFLKTSQEILGAKNVYTSTNDGSFGFKGLAHELVQELLRKNEYDQLFSCGPERMMFQIFEIARSNSIPIQLSLERIMKCGIGICGSCSIGEYVLCKDGPVLEADQLEKTKPEFGASKRDRAGALTSI